MTNDWKTMAAGLDLDRVIAERLGWTEIEERDCFTEDPWGSGFERYLYGRDPKDGWHEYLPRYSTDLSVAVRLADGIKTACDLHLITDWVEHHIFWKADYKDHRRGEEMWATEPALALCYAFLAFHDAGIAEAHDAAARPASESEKPSVVFFPLGTELTAEDRAAIDALTADPSDESEGE